MHTNSIVQHVDKAEHSELAERRCVAGEASLACPKGRPQTHESLAHRRAVRRRARVRALSPSHHESPGWLASPLKYLPCKRTQYLLVTRKRHEQHQTSQEKRY